MKKIDLTKEGLFRFLDMLGLTPEDLASIREWLTEYSARKADALPCKVEYIGHDPDGEQTGMPTVLTTHLSKLEEGDPVIAHLGVKLFLYPLKGKEYVQTVSDLILEAKQLWESCHPITLADWNKFCTHQKTYMDLNKIFKGLKREFSAVEGVPGLLDIRDHVHYLHDTDPHYTMCTRLDIATGDTKVVPISTIDYILCVVD